MLKNIFFCTLLCTAFFSSGFSQSNPPRSAVTGTVTDPDGDPIPDATISVIEPEGSELITGGATNTDGKFSVNINPGTYIIRVSYISYTTHQQTVDIEGEDVSLGEISLEKTAAQLEDVVVEGERSYMEMNFDSRTFNVGADITSLGGSALDVLDNVPSITTDFEGNVSLRGNQGVQILINGRPSSLVRSGTDALSSIPSNMIEKVEVITNPSACYSADGTAGVINIVLVDNARLGFNGRVHGNTGYPQNHEIGINLNHNVNNINWFVSSSLEYQNQPRSGSTFQSFSADTTYAFRENRDSEQSEREGDIRFGADIFLPGSQVLTASTRVDIERGNRETDMLYTDYDPGEAGVYRNVFDEWDMIQQTSREDINEQRENDYEFRLEYEKRFSGRNHRLMADADFEFGWDRDDSDLTEITNTGTATTVQQRSFSDEDYREFRFDINYEQPVGENAKFEAGGRANFDWMDNDYVIEELRGSEWIIPENMGVNDNFTYFENVNALYMIYAGGAGKFSYQLGARAENTRIETKLDQTGAGSDQNYLNLFPSAFLSYQLNEKNSFQINYSRRISRPWSRMLLPFTEISDSRNRNIGNPELNPEFGNSYEAGYLRYWESGSVLTNLYYRYRTGVIERVSTIDSNGITTRRPINLATEEAWGVEFSADQELFKDLQLSGSLNLFQSNREGEYQGETYTGEASSFTSRLRIRWRFLEGWRFQTYAFYRGARKTTQGRRAGSMFMGSAIAKTILDGRGTLSLNVRDPFNTRHSDREIINPQSYTLSKNQWSSRSFRLNFRYNFGGRN